MTLWERWQALWAQLGLRGDPRPVFDDLAARYCEPHRAYHTLEHLEHVFAELDEVLDRARAAELIQLAVWFHDAVYDTRAGDCEAQSAELLKRALAAAGAPADATERTAAMVLATRHDRRASPDPDTALLLDADLAILGQCEIAFDVYEAAVRREYAWVPDAAFRQGRTAVLSRFLARPNIYSTPHFHALYEAQARENLARSIAALSSGDARS